MNSNQAKSAFIDIETRGEKRKRARCERDAARSARNYRQQPRESPQLNENVQSEPGGIFVAEIETRGEKRKRAHHERDAVRRTKNQKQKPAERHQLDQNGLSQ